MGLGARVQGAHRMGPAGGTPLCIQVPQEPGDLGNWGDADGPPRNRESRGWIRNYHHALFPPAHLMLNLPSLPGAQHEAPGPLVSREERAGRQVWGAASISAVLVLHTQPRRVNHRQSREEPCRCCWGGQTGHGHHQEHHGCRFGVCSAHLHVVPATQSFWLENTLEIESKC